MKMKKILTLAFSFAALTLSAQQKEEIMSVYTTDGVKVDYRVSEVEKVEFTTIELEELAKQCEIGNTIYDINTVREVKSDGGTTYNIFGDDASTPLLSITLPDGGLGVQYTLGTAAAEEVRLKINGNTTVKDAKGSLRVNKDKTGNTLTISLEAYYSGGRLRAAYRGTFSAGYTATNRFTIIPGAGDIYTNKVGTVFAKVDAETGTRTFAFGPVESDKVIDMHNGEYAVLFTLSNSKFNSGKVDLAQNPESYTLTIINYIDETEIKADAGTTGYITAYSDSSVGENGVYFTYNIMLADGTILTGDYYGETKMVDNFDEMMLTQSVGNSFTVSNAYAEVISKVDITEMQVKESGGYTYLYFMSEGNKTPNDAMITPMIKLRSTLIGTGVINLAQTDPYTWEVKYKEIQHSSADNEYMNKTQQGELNVSKQGDVYNVQLNLLDSYTTPWSSSPSGSMKTLSISFTGKGAAYTGK